MHQALKSGRVNGASVRSDLDPRLREVQPDVRLVHHEVGRLHPIVFGQNEVHHRVDPVLALRGRDLAEAHPGELPVLRLVEPRDKHVPRRRQHAQALPVERLVLDLGPQLRPRVLAREVVEQFAVGSAPRREARAQSRRARRVGIHVSLHIEPLAARTVYAGDRLRPLGIVSHPARLQVVDLRRYAALPADSDHLVDRLEQLVALRPHVGDVDAARALHHFRDLHQLLGRREVAGRVDQGSRETQRAILHRPRGRPLHLLERGVGRRTLGEGHPILPERAAADKRANVDARSALLDHPEHLGEPMRLGEQRQEAPGHRIGRIERRRGARQHLAAQRGRRAALAEHLRGHALCHLAHHPRIAAQERAGGATLDVDEPRRHHHSRGVKPLPGGRTTQRAPRGNRGNAVAGDGDVAVEPRGARAVDHAPVLDDEIVARPSG